MKYLMLLSMLLTTPAFAQDQVFRAYAGANVIWFQGDLSLPNDVEVGATGRASLSEHISLVSAGFFGLDKSYVRGSAGVRVTATDVSNPNFSVGFGVERQFSSEPRLRPEEWAGTASLGWKPWPETSPRLIFGAQAAYGFDSQQASGLLGLRYALGD